MARGSGIGKLLLALLWDIRPDHPRPIVADAESAMTDISEATGYKIGEWSLSPGFRLQLDRDGFHHIGYHQISGGRIIR
jgi:hypothetical protein